MNADDKGKRLKTDDKVAILLLDKGRVTVVVDKKDYDKRPTTTKIDTLVTYNHIYAELKRDPTTALNYNTAKVDLALQQLRCSVPQPS